MGVNPPCLIPMILSFAFKHCHYNNLTITKPDYIKKNKTQKLFCCAITVFGSMYVFKHCHNNNLKSTELTFIHMDNKYHIRSLKKNHKKYLILDNSHDLFCKIFNFLLNVNCKWIGGNIIIHCEFLEYWNTPKSVWRIWQHFLCLLDEGIPKIWKKLNSYGGFLTAD